MRAIKKARKFIENQPTDDASQTLASLILALEQENEFPLQRLYKLPLDKFDLSLELMKDWRVDRYYAGKTKALSSAMASLTEQPK